MKALYWVNRIYRIYRMYLYKILIILLLLYYVWTYFLFSDEDWQGRIIFRAIVREYDYNLLVALVTGKPGHCLNHSWFFRFVQWKVINSHVKTRVGRELKIEIASFVFFFSRKLPQSQFLFWLRFWFLWSCLCQQNIWWLRARG